MGFSAKILAVGALTAGFSIGAHANAFDDCVLKNMQGVTSDIAAKPVKIACLRKSSVPLT